jgi:hypothetical protein
VTECIHPVDSQQIYAPHLWPSLDDIECRDCGDIRKPTADEFARFSQRGPGWLLQSVRDAAGGSKT